MPKRKFNPLSFDLGNALLLRHSQICSQMPNKPEEITDAHIQAAINSYKDLLVSIGAPESLAHSIGKYLFEVAGWCVEKGHPPVNALAVNGTLRQPGTGYFLAPGGGDWDAEIKQCIAWNSYPAKMSI